MNQTPFRVVIATAGNRFVWRLVTANGHHGVIVESGSAYLSEASARAGAKRFIAMYFRNTAEDRMEPIRHD